MHEVRNLSGMFLTLQKFASKEDKLELKFYDQNLMTKRDLWFDHEDICGKPEIIPGFHFCIIEINSKRQSLRLIDKVCHSQTHCIAPTSKDFHVAWLEWSCRLFALCVSLSFSPISTSVSRSRQCLMGKDRPIIDASSFDRRRVFKFFVANVRDFCVTRDYISPAFNS